MFGRTGDRLRVGQCLARRVGGGIRGGAGATRRGAHGIRGHRHSCRSLAYVFQGGAGLGFDRVSHVGQRGPLFCLGTLVLFVLLRPQAANGQGIILEHNNGPSHFAQLVPLIGVPYRHVRIAAGQIAHHPGQGVHRAGDAAAEQEAG
ncbi:MAG: hypothetical protein QOH05_1245, partial [Acetobacteraceae bacterium]|nr:hypothetical protein [Acetobacteraceae bacterium]